MTATGGGPTEKLIYRQVFEAILKGLSDRATVAFKNDLKAIGVNVDKLMPGYEYEVFEKTILAAAKLFPELSPLDAQAEVGRRLTLSTIDANPVGKTLLPLLKMMGTGRALRRAYGKSTSENYNVATFSNETPKSVEMHMSWVGNIPDMTRGSAVGLGEAMGVPLRAKVLSHTAPAATFLLEWG